MNDRRLTAKGTATRDRIVAAAADLVLERGADRTSLDEIGDVAGAGRSQLFHYFPGGKHELVAAISVLQSRRVLEAQRPHIDEFDTWASWEAWKNALVEHYRRQPHLACPVSALANELLGHDPEHGEAVAKFMLDWQGLLEAGVHRMIANGHLATGTDPTRVAEMMFACLQGGLVLMQTRQTLDGLQAGVDAAMIVLRDQHTSHRDADGDRVTHSAESTR